MTRHLLLWSSLALSTLLSAAFFFSLGDDAIAGGVLAAVGIIFEGLKAYAWNRVGAKRLSYLWLGLPCTALSLVASVGFASLTLERGWSNTERIERLGAISSDDRASLMREEQELLDAIAKLPPGWTSSTLRLSTRLDTVREARAHLDLTTAPSAVARTTTSLAISLARRFGLDGAWVVTSVLLAIATLLEVGVVVLALDGDTRKHAEAPPRQSSDCDRFLSAAVGPNGRLLGRRRLVELGWTEKEIREHVATLLRSGVLIHQGRGSPVRLAPRPEEA